MNSRRLDFSMFRLITGSLEGPEEILDSWRKNPELERVVPGLSFLHAAKPDFLIQLIESTVPHIHYQKHDRMLCLEGELETLSHHALNRTVHYMMRIAAKWKNAVFVHSSCVQITENTCMLICGQSGSGKSSLALALACRGYPIVGTDLTLVQGNRSLGGTIHMNLYLTTLKNSFPDLYAQLDAPSFEGKIELPVAKLQPYYADKNQWLEISHIFLVELKSGAATRTCQKLSLNDCLEQSIVLEDVAQWSDWIQPDWLCFYPHLEDAETLTTTYQLARYIAALPHYRLVGDLDFAVRTIESLCRGA